MRTTDVKLLVITFFLLAGCGRPRGDSASAKNPNQLTTKQVGGITIEVQGMGHVFALGQPALIAITLKNSSARSIWVDEKTLPWTDPFSLIADPKGQCLEALYPIGVTLSSVWKRLEPGETLSGSVDLSSILYVKTKPLLNERVEVELSISVWAIDVDPARGESSHYFSLIPKCLLGHVIVKVPGSIPIGL
jgi:hypothetical protein